MKRGIEVRHFEMQQKVMFLKGELVDEYPELIDLEDSIDDLCSMLSDVSDTWLDRLPDEFLELCKLHDRGVADLYGHDVEKLKEDIAQTMQQSKNAVLLAFDELELIQEALSTHCAFKYVQKYVSNTTIKDTQKWIGSAEILGLKGDLTDDINDKKKLMDRYDTNLLIGKKPKQAVEDVKKFFKIPDGYEYALKQTIQNELRKRRKIANFLGVKDSFTHAKMPSTSGYDQKIKEKI